MVPRPRLSACAALLAATFFFLTALFSQAPTGTISGSATDESGALVPGAKITVTNRATGLTRTLVTGQEGTYSVPSLPAGEYEVRCEADGFRVLIRPASVETGNSTRVDLPMQVGTTRDVVTVEEATSQISYESHRIDGVVTRKQIEELPLNGRSFLQLAFLEPGVGVNANSLAQYNAQFSVSILGGASNMAAITVDGGNIRNPIEGNTGMNFSQEMVEEFQISSVNFDLSTPITGVGAVNIVTRSGGNDYHGSGYFYFRDHNMSAYPALARNPLNPDPFFARRQSGGWIGGPIKKDRLFFFFNIEHNNQDSVVTVQPNSAFFAALVGNYSQPYTGKQISQRFDWRVNDKHNLFVRYSHDGNNGFGPSGTAATLPSNWLKNTNWSDQSILGVTSAFTSTLVNDFRFSYQYWRNRNLFPEESDCPGCIGLGLPQMQVAGTNVTFGNTSNATQGRDLRRFNFTDNITWQRGSHRWRFGGEYEHAPGTGFWGYADPAAGVVFGPEVLGPLAAAFGFPSSFRSNADLFKLPVAGFSMGIGNPSQPPPYNVDIAKLNNRHRLFWQDTWRLHSRFTLNYGVAWQYESNLVNHDLDKPPLLAPVLGANQVGASQRDYNNFSPSLGFAWNLGNDNKTVIRGGGGMYYDSRLLSQRLEERGYLGPVGNGRILVPGSAVPSPIAIPSPVPGVLAPVNVGTALNFPSAPTGFTLGHLMQILPGIRAAAERSTANPNPNDLSVRGIERAKSAANLIPQYYPAAYSIHYNLGFQRELRRNMVLNADFVIRKFVHQEIGSLDYNRYNRVGGPVLPVCTAAQVANDKAICGTGSITVRTPAGRNSYKALLVKLDKRLSSRYQFTASYALTAQHGLNDIMNLDNWFETWGPQGSRHSLNVSGIIDLPWKFQASFIVSMASRGPFKPIIPVIDLNGDGSSGEPLPGARINGFNRGLGKEDLARLVNEFNQNYAGRRTSRNQLIPTLTLPASYEFGDRFSSHDLRLTKYFNWRERYKLSAFVEIFNLFNIANLGGYSNQLTNPAAFGQPTSRAGQVFGTGGPRAFQLGARFSF